MLHASRPALTCATLALDGLLAPAPSAFGAAAETITGIGDVLMRVHAASFTATELNGPRPGS